MRDRALPAGYQDADLEMAKLKRQGDALAAARRAGRCGHGWRQVHDPEPRAPEADDLATCLDCGKTATWAELDAERDDILGGC